MRDKCRIGKGAYQIKKMMVEIFSVVFFLLVFVSPALGLEEDDFPPSPKKNLKKTEPLGVDITDQENLGVSLEALKNKKKGKYGRTASPDIGLEINFFFAKVQSKTKFGPDEPPINLQTVGGLSQFTTQGGVELFLRSATGKIGFKFFRTNFRGRDNGPSQDIVADGQTFLAGDPTRSRHTLSRWTLLLSYSALPEAVEGLRFNFFLDFSYFLSSERLSNTSGSIAKSEFGTMVPNLGFNMELALLYSNPSDVTQLFRPHPYLTLFFQIQGIAFLDYSSRRVLDYYELEVGIRIKPTDFFHIAMYYQTLSLAVKETEEKNQVEVFMGGFSFAFTLKF